MKVLFVHQNFPAQYAHVAAALAQRPGHEVVALCMSDPKLAGVRVVRHAPAGTSTPGLHASVGDFEAKILRGESAARAALALAAEGFRPDVICGHPGWGETLFLRDIWPDARILSYVEFVYRAKGTDVDFDPEFAAGTIENSFRVRAMNASLFLAFEASDWLVSPTAWQASQLPAGFRDRTSVIHDGIDTDLLAPNPKAFIELGRGRIRAVPGDEIITFVNRNLEPYRGYHSFMRALPAILKARPKARVVIVGGNDVSYGARPKDGRTYRQMFLDEVMHELDMDRVHFVGKIPYAAYISLLQVSAAHVYLTYPFVLSWSLLESMAAGCAVVGSDTAPVQEVIGQGETGRLVDFFSPPAIAEAVIDVLAKPARYRAMRSAARRAVVARFDLKRVCLPQQLALIDRLAAT